MKPSAKCGEEARGNSDSCISSVEKMSTSMLCSISNPFAWLFFTDFGRFLVVDDYPVPAANLKYINQKVASAESEWAGQLR